MNRTIMLFIMLFMITLLFFQTVSVNALKKSHEIVSHNYNRPLDRPEESVGPLCETCEKKMNELTTQCDAIKHERDQFRQALSTLSANCVETDHPFHLHGTSGNKEDVPIATTTIVSQKKKAHRYFPAEYVSFKHLIPSSNKVDGGRRRLAECPTFKFDDDASLSGSNGVNVLSSSCTMGSDFTILNGKTLKIKKDPTMVDELIIDRQATSSNRGRHFSVSGDFFVEGVTLTGGYVSAFFI